MKKNKHTIIFSKLIIILSFLFLGIEARTQTLNLVPNPSFENFTDCPWDVHCGAIYQVENWYNVDFTPCPQSYPFPYQASSPDFFNICGQNFPNSESQNVPNNFAGSQWGFNNTNSYAGFYAYHSGTHFQNYREYIGTTLSDVLKPNKQYLIKMHISLGDWYVLGTNGIGMHLSSSPIQINNNGFYNGSTRIWQTLDNLAPQLIVTTPVTDKINWVPIETTFVADGGEQYLIIGNFLNDNQINLIN